MKSLLLVGGGGHCRSSIDVIEKTGQFKVVGIVDQASKVGQNVLGIPVIGTDTDLGALKAKAGFAMITVGQIRTPEIRMGIYQKLKEHGYQLPTVVSPLAHVSSHAVVGEGTLVMHHAIINAGAWVGENCIINSKSLLEHDVRVENHCHISTGAILNGEVTVGEGTFIGSGSVVREQIKIGSRCIVALGSAVYKNISDGSTYYAK